MDCIASDKVVLGPSVTTCTLLLSARPGRGSTPISTPVMMAVANHRRCRTLCLGPDGILIKAPLAVSFPNKTASGKCLTAI